MLINGDKIVDGFTQSPAHSFVLGGSLVAATDTAVGGVIKRQNDTGLDLIITDVLIDVTTKSTGAATLDIGVDDGGDVSSDNLLDGVDVGTAAGLFNSRKNAGTNGKQAVLWKNGEYLVASASASVAGIVGKYKIYAVAR